MLQFISIAKIASSNLFYYLSFSSQSFVRILLIVNLNKKKKHEIRNIPFVRRRGKDIKMLTIVHRSSNIAHTNALVVNSMHRALSWLT